MNANDLKIYAAGFMDGEGCITVEWNRNGQPIVIVLISQNEIEPLEMLQETYSGWIRLHGKNHRLKMSNRIAENFLRDILPWLVVKKRQAEAAIELRESMTFQGTHEMPPEEDARRLHLVSLIMKRGGQ